jgi:DNA-binding HxlR family transcriptional regulator
MELIKVEFVDRIEYKNELGQRHNEDGPAIEGYNGYKEWWINGQRHREDGPAVQYYNGEKLWYLNGQNYSEDDWKQEVAKINTMSQQTLLQELRFFVSDGLNSYDEGIKVSEIWDKINTMSQQTLLQELRFFVSDGLNSYDEGIKVSEIWDKINELLEKEKQQKND